jgi:hypothetical protein
MSENQVITIITALTPLYPFLFALALLLFRWLVAKLPYNQQVVLNQIVQLVVNAVEQVGAGKAGPEKKLMAIKMIGDILRGFHITASPALIDALIESAVYGINQSRLSKLSSVPTDLVSPNTPAILEQTQHV